MPYLGKIATGSARALVLNTFDDAFRMERVRLRATPAKLGQKGQLTVLWQGVFQGEQYFWAVPSIEIINTEIKLLGIVSDRHNSTQYSHTSSLHVLVLPFTLANMKAPAIFTGIFALTANAELCRYRIRSYQFENCQGPVKKDAYLNSMDCFDTGHQGYIWIDNVTGSEYCDKGNWIREYSNPFHQGSCSNNHRGQWDVEMRSCFKIPHLFEGLSKTDSIRINYA